MSILRVFVALVSVMTASSASAIVGGQEANVREHPWQVRLESDGHFCGGVLLNATWVLTAAHCFLDHDWQDVTVTLGDHREAWPDLTEQVRTIADYIPHPRFTGTSGYRNDIALIELSAPATFTSAVQPIEIAAGDYDVGATVTLSGWGVVHASSFDPSEVLKDAELPMVSNETCDDLHNWTTYTGSMLCAGTPGTSGVASSCRGDSGGPLVVNDPVHGKRLVGISSQVSPTCQHYTVATRVRDFVPWIESVIGTRPPICSGRSAPGNTTWVQYDSDTIRTEIDTNACALTGFPLYFATLGGTGGHYVTEGVTSIYHATANSFFVYVSKPGVTVATADSSKWHVNWAAAATGTNVPGVCTGASPTNTWVQYNANTIYIDVNTSSCGFGSTPSYFTSLYGTSGHPDSIGATSIYSPTATGFRVYVKKSGVTPVYAAGRSWRIVWRAEPASVSYEDVCNGKTTAGSTSWVQHNANAVYVNVNTSACELTTAPKYFTVLGGSSQHFDSQGATAIYSPTATGFRIYVSHGGVTPTEANDRRWHIVWNARP
jgi:hypothetical protein